MQRGAGLLLDAVEEGGGFVGFGEEGGYAGVEVGCDFGEGGRWWWWWLCRTGIIGTGAVALLLLLLLLLILLCVFILF